MSPWYAEGLAFECTACGKCCTTDDPARGAVWITIPEAQRLTDHLGLSLPDFLAALCDRRGDRITLKLARMEDRWRCLFLDPQTKQCGVHAVKPDACRSHPFWPRFVASRQEWERFGREVCEGIGTGPIVSAEEITQRLKRWQPPASDRERTAEEWYDKVLAETGDPQLAEVAHNDCVRACYRAGRTPE